MMTASCRGGNKTAANREEEEQRTMTGIHCRMTMGEPRNPRTATATETETAATLLRAAAAATTTAAMLPGTA